MSAHHHVAATVHAHRTRARAAIGHAATKAPRAALTHQPGDAVVDTVTGQDGVILSGKTIHVHTQNPAESTSGNVSGATG
jgi:hypothetical protein